MGKSDLQYECGELESSPATGTPSLQPLLLISCGQPSSGRNRASICPSLYPNDIIGGNSGSPLIDAKADVIGAVFDGDIYSLGGDYGYDGAVNRSVVVSTGAVTEALQKVYGADALVRELSSGS